MVQLYDVAQRDRGEPLPQLLLLRLWLMDHVTRVTGSNRGQGDQEGVEVRRRTDGAERNIYTSI